MFLSQNQGNILEWDSVHEIVIRGGVCSLQIWLDTNSLLINSLRWPIYINNSVDETKLSCYSPPSTQHHSFFWKLPPLLYGGFLQIFLEGDQLEGVDDFYFSLKDAGQKDCKYYMKDGNFI